MALFTFAQTERSSNTSTTLPQSVKGGSCKTERSFIIEKCIYENAHVALDQTEYQKRYDGLTTRFDTAKARLEEIEAALADKKSRRAAIDAFLDTLAQADPMEKFDPALWCGLIDYVTVYARDDVRFAFKDGQGIKA